MDEQSSRFDWSGLWTRVGVGVVAVMLGVTVYTQFQFREEVEARRSFDARRDFDICVSGNERSVIIAKAIKGVAVDGAEAIIAAASRDPAALMRTPAEEAKYQERLAFYRSEIERRVDKSLEPLKPRDCHKLYKETP